MIIHIWRHFARNTACAKKSIAWWCDDAITMVRWRQTHGCDRSSLHRHNTIASSTSLNRHRTVVPSRHRYHIIALSLSLQRFIAPSTLTRWCDGTIVDCVALSGFHNYFLLRKTTTDVMIGTYSSNENKTTQLEAFYCPRPMAPCNTTHRAVSCTLETYSCLMTFNYFRSLSESLYDKMLCIAEN